MLGIPSATISDISQLKLETFTSDPLYKWVDMVVICEQFVIPA